MLDSSRILKYIKMKMGFDVNLIEMSDESIIDWISEYTINEYSDYAPETHMTYFDTRVAEPVINQKNMFYFHEPDGRDILSVLECVDSSTMAMVGHPLVGVTHMQEIPSFLQSAISANMTKRFSIQSYVYEFIDPNILRFSGTIPNGIVIWYERRHSKDFGSIQTEWERHFLDLALGDIMILVGEKRKQFSSITTPYGEVNIDVDIGSRGQEIKDRVLENLSQIVPELIIDVY